MTNDKLDENLWSLANGITAFAVLQALAFLYKLGDKVFIETISNVGAQVSIVGFTAIFGIFYCIAVQKCRRHALTLGGNPAVWNGSTIGRVWCVALFNGMCILFTLLIALRP